MHPHRWPIGAGQEPEGERDGSFQRSSFVIFRVLGPVPFLLLLSGSDSVTSAAYVGWDVFGHSLDFGWSG